MSVTNITILGENMKKVLIVEDTKQLADLYKHRLEKEYQVMILPDGDKVL